MNDPIYLLSIEEYKKYQQNIPHLHCRWWLRSPGFDSGHAAYVRFDGLAIDINGYFVGHYDGAVRPALSLDTSGLTIGQRVVRYDFPWIVVGEGVAIAEVPIAFRRFDAESNNYETS